MTRDTGEGALDMTRVCPQAQHLSGVVESCCVSEPLSGGEQSKSAMSLESSALAEEIQKGPQAENGSRRKGTGMKDPETAESQECGPVRRPMGRDSRESGVLAGEEANGQNRDFRDRGGGLGSKVADLEYSLGVLTHHSFYTQGV